VGKDGESVLKKKVELSDTEMKKWARESFVERRALCVNYLPKSEQISFSFSISSLSNLKQRIQTR
jgi:hypothetical protein